MPQLTEITQFIFSQPLSPQRKKEKTFEALLRQLAGLARQQPVLMIFEDLHWADPTSGELLELTVEQIERLPVLPIATFRPEFQASWAGQSHVTALTLRRLGREESGTLVHRLIGGAALSPELVDEIVERTDGVPLFVEELTKAVLEARSSATNDGSTIAAAVPAIVLAVPATLHASLMARLDRLGPAAREVAQVGAAIGREFSYGLLVAAAQRTVKEVGYGLNGLVRAGLVFQRGAIPEATFLFKHALVRDAAHSILLRGARRQLHARIAEALEEQSPELMDTQPELFAQHYADAGLAEKSVAYWGKAGRRAAARSAMVEATAQFQKGLDQLALLPDNYARQRHELELRTALGTALMLVKGFAAPEPGDAYARAHELWQQLGYPPEFHQVPYGQSRYYLNRGDLDLAQHSAEVLLSLSRQRNDPGGLVLGNHCLGRTLFVAGRFARSRLHFEEGCAVYDTISHRPLVDQAGVHPQVMSRGELGIVLFCLGFPEQALACTKAAIAEARTLSHPPSLAVSSASGTILFSLVGDDAALKQATDEITAVATEHSFPLWGAWGTIYQGWLKVKTVGAPKGIPYLRKGLTAYQASGADTWMPHFLYLVARACEIAGQTEEGLSVLNDALQIVERTGERWFTAELNRYRGQLVLRQGDVETAEELYYKALGIAREQAAKLWELRAAVSLARLWPEQGRRAEARRLLAPVYGWFTEGFGTSDLKEAKALLDELS